MPDTDQAKPAKKRIVVFADGTGNAFTHQESNIWRMYTQLDRTGEEQIARYIPGVGTQSIGILATIDGAVGFGVPSNVRELYRFICWNWQPDDEIWMFGFSRGAFTVRALATMIATVGLMPREIGGVPVPHDVMVSNSENAWRSYRAVSARTPFWSSYMLVAAGRWLSRTLRSVTAATAEYRRATEWLARPENSARRYPRIRFLGAFDTVEAYGVPVEELRPLVDRVIWPIRFKSRKPSPQIDDVRHALALDDERTTFHPVRFDQSNNAVPPNIREVWFAGMHSDVGGGYPDDTIARIPLVWMAREAECAGLRFLPGTIPAWERQSSDRGEVHDSRAGFHVMYRYQPRPIESGEAEGGPPVLHESVAERIADRSNNYAPLNVPDKVRFQPAHPPGDHSIPAPAIINVPALRPDVSILETARDIVWWRRVHYFVMLGGLVILAAFPWLSGFLSPLRGKLQDALGQLAGEEISRIGREVVLFIRGFFEFFGTFIPGFARPWFEALMASPVLMSALIVAIVYINRRGTMLKHMISDYAISAWRTNGETRPTPGRLPSMDFARRMRQSKGLGMAYRFTKRFLIPGLAALVVVLGLASVVGRKTVVALGKSGRICNETHPGIPLERQQWPALRPGETVTPSKAFDAASPCWGTGISVVKGVTYTVTLTSDSHFVDYSTIAPLQGFADRWSLGHNPVSAFLFRRWPSAAWFQPVYQIGEDDRVSEPLKSLDGRLPAGESQIGELLLEAPGWHVGEPFTSLPADRVQEGRKQIAERGSPAPFVARFTAQQDGKLFLYLNDALIGLPIIGILDQTYRNNVGKANVVIEARSAANPCCQKP